MSFRPPLGQEREKREEREERERGERDRTECGAAVSK